MKKKTVSFCSNSRIARELWGGLSRVASQSLKQATLRYSLSVAAGDLQLLNGCWYVTHSGLLGLASGKHCAGIETILQEQLTDIAAGRWVFKAIVYKSNASKGFVGYGDADPSNISSVVRGAEMRIAETRAVNRALRKAYGIGLCSVEELGASSSSARMSPSPLLFRSSNGNGSNNGQPRLRDRLCLLIRQYNLDPNLVKAYAADFCGTETLRPSIGEGLKFERGSRTLGNWVPAPVGATGYVKGITVTTKPFLWVHGKHRLAVSAQMPDSQESDLSKCTTIVKIR